MTAHIRQVLARSDNFAVLLHDPASGATAAIDAPEADAIEDMLAATGWRLSHILVTHEHFDHVEGIEPLKRKYDCRVIAPAKATRVPLVDQTVTDGDVVSVGNVALTVLETPGHCPDHVAYWSQADGVVFVGDTLFALGCGRMFNSTPSEFWASLQKLAALPDETKVYCGHEYTLANARFALSVDPDNPALRARASEVEALRANGQMTLPTTIGIERATNPFLRVEDQAIKERLGMVGAVASDVFAELRERKNRF